MAGVCCGRYVTCHRGEWQQAFGLLAEMGKRAVQPDFIAFGATDTACEKGDR